MSLNLTQMRERRPSLRHGAVAASRLPFVPANDAAALARAAQQLGFQSVGPNQYQHQDGSWLALVGNRLERGHQTTQFRGVPVDITQLPVLPRGQAVAAQQVAPTATPTLRADLTRLGFTETVTNFFAAADGSWVALMPDQSVLRGLQQSLLHPADVPPATARARTAQPAQAPPAAPAAPSASADDVLRAPYTARAPRFEDGFLACAQVPFLNAGSAGADRQTLQGLGFTEKAPGFFVHPGDNSWIAYTSAGRIERGVDHSLFQRVPQSPARLGASPPPAHAFVFAIADPKLAALTQKDVASSDQPLLDAGFTKKAAHYYVHVDGSFIAFSPSAVHTGNGNQIFSSSPPPFDALPRQPSRPEHGFAAIVKTVQLTGQEPNLGQILGGFGFQASLPGRFYEHADGSFVVLHGGALHRGHGGAVFSDVPQPPPPGVYQAYARKPGGSWSQWQKQFAIAKLPLFSGQFSAAQAAKILQHLGFLDSGRGVWTHPDGSQLTLSGNPPYFQASRFQKWNFSQFPYQNVSDGTALMALTGLWERWVTRGGSPPF